MSELTAEQKAELKKSIKDEAKFNELFNKVFAETDKDGSGKIDKNEFKNLQVQFAKMLDLPCPNDDEIEIEFKRMDKDKSGLIDKEEFRKVVRELCIYA